MKNLFGALRLGKTGKGENPNGPVSQTANGTDVDGWGADGNDYTFAITADGARWNRTMEDAGRMMDRHVPRPVTTLFNRKT